MLSSIKDFFDSDDVRRKKLREEARTAAQLIVSRFISNEFQMVDLRVGDISSNVVVMNGQKVAVFAFSKQMLNRHWFNIDSKYIVKRYIHSMLKEASYEEVITGLADIYIINTEPKKGGTKVV